MRELPAEGLRQVGPPQTSIDPTAIICGSIHLDCQCDILDIRRPDVCSVNPEPLITLLGHHLWSVLIAFLILLYW